MEMKRTESLALGIKGQTLIRHFLVNSSLKRHTFVYLKIHESLFRTSVSLCNFLPVSIMCFIFFFKSRGMNPELS